MSEHQMQSIMEEFTRAIDTRDAARLEKALAAGADPNAKIGMDTAMTRAIRMYRTPEDLATIISLYAAGADMAATSMQGDTPLIAALIKLLPEDDMKPLIDFLLAAGPDASYVPYPEKSPLLIALETDFTMSTDWRFRRMLAAGADADAPLEGLLDNSKVRPRNLRDALDMTVEWGVFQREMTEEECAHVAHLRSLLPPMPAVSNRQAVKEQFTGARFKLKGLRA